MLILGLTGPAGCGKSTVAKYLVDHHSFVEIAFADPLKDMLAALLGEARENLDRLLADREWKERPCSTLGGKSPRQALQLLGTEWGRQLMHPDIWVLAVRSRIEWVQDVFEDEGHHIVISDVRFANEAAFVRQHGRLAHVSRPDAAPVAAHTSESGVLFDSRDFHLDNHGSLAQLHKHLDGVMPHLLRAAA